MSGKFTLGRVRRARRRGQEFSSPAGEFFCEEMRHIREGKHRARSAELAMAVGLSKAWRGVAL